jgi:hypothetical protein
MGKGGKEGHRGALAQPEISEKSSVDLLALGISIIFASISKYSSQNLRLNLLFG